MSEAVGLKNIFYLYTNYTYTCIGQQGVMVFSTVSSQQESLNPASVRGLSMWSLQVQKREVSGLG